VEGLPKVLDSQGDVYTLYIQMKTPTTFRLTDVAKTLLEKIARSLGLTSTAALEMIIREAAKKREIK
jgi:hypothetical protein